MALARFVLEADGVVVEGEGVVTVTGAPTVDLPAQIRAWLDTIDPDDLQQAALARQGMGSRSITPDLLAVLHERAAEAGQ